MPRPKGVTQLELLRRKQAEITEQLQAAEAKELDRLTRIDTQRRETLALCIGDHLKSRPETPFAVSIFEFLAAVLTRPAERALFPELPARSAAKKTTKAKAKVETSETT